MSKVSWAEFSGGAPVSIHTTDEDGESKEVGAVTTSGKTGTVSMADFAGGGAVSVVGDDKPSGPSPTRTKPETAEKEVPGLFSDISDRWDERTDQAIDIFTAQGAGEQSILETGVQLAGKVGVGTFFDIVGELAESGFEVSKDALQAIPATNVVAEPLGIAWNAIKDSSLAQAGTQAFAEGVGEYNAWASENPRAARNLEGVTNLATALSPVKVKAKLGPDDLDVAKPTALQTMSEDLGEAAAKQGTQERENFVQKLVIPKEDKKNIGQRVVGSETQGPLKQEVYKPNASEREMIRVVSEVKGVTPKNTVRQNYREIDKEIGVRAKKLEADIQKMNMGGVPRKEVRSRIAGTLEALSTKNLQVGDAAKQASLMVKELNNILENHKSTPLGLLQARREFDNWIMNQSGGSKTLNTDLSTARSEAALALRNTLNEIVADKVPNAKVRQSLREQHLMFRGLDAMKETALKEKLNVIGRTWDTVRSIVPVRNEAIQAAAVVAGSTAIGIVGVVAPVMGAVAGAGLMTYAGGKFIMSKKTKKGLASLLKATDDAIRLSKNKDMIKRMRADRAAILEVIQNAEIAAEEAQGEAQSAPPAMPKM